jgi:hypothetical protein
MTLAHLQVGVMLAMTVLQLVWYLGIWRARATYQDDLLPKLEERIKDLEQQMIEMRSMHRIIEEIRQRLEVVGTRSHEAVNRINGLPDVLSGLFLRKDIANVIIQEATEDRQRLHRKLDDLWQELRRDK